MLCPLCATLVSEAEGDLLSHLLARHPLALAVLTGCLAAAHLALARKPRDLLAVDAAVLGVGFLMSRT